MVDTRFTSGSLFTALTVFLAFLCPVAIAASEAHERGGTDTTSVSEEDYFQIVTLPAPDDVILEVGGLTMLPSGKLAVVTRRGEVWTVGNPGMAGGSAPYYTRFAQGMYEPMGLHYKDGSLYTAQRGELTKLTDTSGDGRSDLYERVYAWPLSGHYHEYSFGPALLPSGDMIVTTNVAFDGEAESRAPWRGWTLIISPDGEMRPYASGMRSPAGVTVNDRGDIFYTENEGDWIGSGFITHLEAGDFAGNPASLRWADRPESPVKVRREDIVEGERPMYELAENVPGLKLPAVWVPHTLMGISTSDLLQDTKGRFGPFKGHYFVGDQGHALINRVFMEQIDGKYQGAVFPFRSGFASGVMRMSWGEEGSMFVGMTDRGWPSTGEQEQGLQRLKWTGKVPFEMKAIKAMPDGFEIEFTKPADRELAANPAFYNVASFNYMYRSAYGSPIIRQEDAPIRGLKVSEDGKRVRLVVDNLREKYVHEVKLGGIRSQYGVPLLHDVAYYTLNHVPSGPILAEGELTAVSDPDHHAVSKVTGSVERMEEQPEEETAEMEERGDAQKRVTEIPASWENGPDQTIRLATRPGLLFDIETIEVEAGAQIALVFDNDDTMVHNVVIVQPGTADEVGEQAMNLGLEGEAMHYVPNSDMVLHYTSVVQPGRSETIYFTAPTTPGSYTYVCTFPGHHFTMQGTLEVR